jgi:hypothetical protein
MQFSFLFFLSFFLGGGNSTEKDSLTEGIISILSQDNQENATTKKSTDMRH